MVNPPRCVLTEYVIVAMRPHSSYRKNLMSHDAKHFVDSFLTGLPEAEPFDLLDPKTWERAERVKLNSRLRALLDHCWPIGEPPGSIVAIFACLVIMASLNKFDLACLSSATDMNPLFVLAANWCLSISRMWQKPEGRAELDRLIPASSPDPKDTDDYLKYLLEWKTSSYDLIDLDRIWRLCTVSQSELWDEEL